MKSQNQKSSTFAAITTVIILVVVLTILTRDTDTTNPVQLESTPVKSVGGTPLMPAPKKSPTYTAYTVRSSRPGAEIAEQVGLSNVPTVLAFNRLDAGHIQQGVVLAIPDILDDWNALSPFPEELSVAKEVSKLFIVSQRVQAFAAYESGRLVRWGPVSTGKYDTQTPSRLYSTNWKGKMVISSIEDSWVLPWYFNLDNSEGISLHQYDLPGYPASHACVRMREEDAQWMYDWARQWIVSEDESTKIASGTPVIIFGQYAYGQTAPWKKLPEDPFGTTISVEELSEVVSGELDMITAEAQKRQEVEASRE